MLVGCLRLVSRLNTSRHLSQRLAATPGILIWQLRTNSTTASMEYNWLGNSGLRVSNLCLGTMTFGEHPGGRPSCTEAESHAILDRYVELGGNFIDTADIYQNGTSETFIGSWLKKQRRDRLVIASKCRKVFDASNVNSVGASRKHIIWSIEESLNRLQTDYVDIYYIHVWDNAVPLEETLSALNDLVHSGKVRYLAMSNAKGWQMQKIVEVSKQKGYERFVALQQQYSLLCRSPEWELMEVCRNEGLGFLPWSPLKGGWLSGKLKRGMAPATDDSRVGWATVKEGRAHHSHPDWAWFSSNEQAWTVLDKLEEIGNKKDKSVPQVALRWLLQKPEIPSVVMGVRTLQQLEDNMGAASGWQLTPTEISTLDEVSEIPAPYPYDYIKKDNADRQRSFITK